jgi:hypothetical protein
MHCKKKYDEGGLFEVNRRTKRKIRKAAKKAERRKNRTQEVIDKGTPSNPRFLTGAPTRVNGNVPNKPKNQDKGKKPKVKTPRGKSSVTQGTRRMLQRAVDPSCRNRSC